MKPHSEVALSLAGNAANAIDRMKILVRTIDARLRKNFI